MKTKAYNLVNSVEQEEMDAGLLAETYSVEAKDGKAVQLPDAFTSQIREDLVRSAVLASRANRRQSYGHREHSGKRSPQPGMKHSVEWWGLPARPEWALAPDRGVLGYQIGSSVGRMAFGRLRGPWVQELKTSS